MIPWLFKWLPILFTCHCRDDRSFHYKGRKFPICARCTGELIGMLAGIFSGPFYLPGVPVLALFLVPLIVDGTVQRLTAYESNNRRRLVTGVLFGYGLVGLIGLSLAWTFSLGQSVGRSLLGR